MKTSIFDIFQARNDEILDIATKFPDTFAYMWHILVEVIKLHTPMLKSIEKITDLSEDHRSIEKIADQGLACFGLEGWAG